MTKEERQEHIKKYLEKDGNYTCRYTISEKYSVTEGTARNDIKDIPKDKKYGVETRKLKLPHKRGHIQIKNVKVIMRKNKNKNIQNENIETQIKKEANLLFNFEKYER